MMRISTTGHARWMSMLLFVKRDTRNGKSGSYTCWQYPGRGKERSWLYTFRSMDHRCGTRPLASLTIRPEINSNEFGCLWKYLLDLSSNFVVVEIIFAQKKSIRIHGVFGVHFHIQCNCACAIVVACFHTCTDVSQQMQTQWK